MGLKLGNLNVANVRLGALQVNSIYLGGTLVWPEVPVFQPGFNATVFSINPLSDGKIIIGGEFQVYQNDLVVLANRIIRLNSEGTRDTTFNMGTGFNSGIRSIAIQPDEKILAGGDFSTYQGVSANRIIRLNLDGSRDTTFNMGTGFNSPNSTQTSSPITVQPDGKIMAGGRFSTYQGVSANRIIRLNLDGSRDTTFNMGTGFGPSIAAVNSIVFQPDGKILVVGFFGTYQGITAEGIIRLNSDGSRDTSFVIGTGFGFTPVWFITLQPDGKILVGGDFQTYRGVAANRIIRLNLDGSRDTTFNMGTGFNGDVRSISIQPDGKILVVGRFSTYQGVSANRIIRLNLDGSRDTTFNMGTGFNSDVDEVTLQLNGKILVGGGFTTYQDAAANRIITLNQDGSRFSS